MQLRPITSGRPPQPIVNRALIYRDEVQKPARVRAIEITVVETQPQPVPTIVIPEETMLSQDILNLVCKRRSVSVAELCGQCRDTHFVTARDVAAWCVRAIMRVSYPAIGRRMGSRDHTTILNNIRNAQSRWSLPDPLADGSRAIALHYLRTGEWDVTQGDETSAA